MGDVPALRFSEFSGKWVHRKLGNIAKVIDCKHRTPPYIDDGIPVVSPGTIKWGDLDLETPVKRVSEKEYLSLMDHCEPSHGNLVFSRNQSLGVASIVVKRDKFVLGQDTVLIQVNDVDTFYIYHLLQTHSMQKKIIQLSGGSTFSRINLKDHQCSPIGFTRGTNLATRERIKHCKDFPVIIAF